jgi:hypothetical protein
MESIMISRFTRQIVSALIVIVCSIAIVRAQDPLPSWNNGKAKQSIVAFVEKVTKFGSPDFVPVAERIATFDNDGTLWCEQPMPVQLFFVIDRVKALASQHPEWKDMEPFAGRQTGCVHAGGLRPSAEGGLDGSQHEE